MEKKNVQTVNEEDLKAATGGFSFRGCKSKSTKKNCESYYRRRFSVKRLWNRKVSEDL